MSRRPLISIIVPVYNAANFIEDGIKSIIMQTCDYEAVFIDDGSTDNSGEIIQRYAADNPRITYHRQANQGVVRARANGVSKANGEWITFLDADDLLTPELSTTVNQWIRGSQTQYDIIIGRDNEKLPTSTDHTIDIDTYRRKVLLQQILTRPVGRFYRRSIFTGWEFDLPCEIVSAEDFLMNIRLMFQTDADVLLLKEQFYIVRFSVNPQSAMKTFKGSFAYGRLFYDCYKASFNKMQWSEYLPETIRHNYIVWYHENRKRWRVPREAIECDSYRDIKAHLPHIGFQPPLLMKLNWKLRNPVIRAILDIMTRFNGIISRQIKSLQH